MEAMSEFRSLPHEMIRAIVWFCSAKSAAYVKVLAPEYRNLFDIIPVLEYLKILGMQRTSLIL